MTMIFRTLILSVLVSLGSSQCYSDPNCQTLLSSDGLNPCLADPNAQSSFNTNNMNCRSFGICYDDDLCEGNALETKTILFRCRGGGANGNNGIDGGSSFYSRLDRNDMDGTCTNHPTFVAGDPHFKTFHGHKYDYQGECDLVLVHNPLFANGTGLDIQIRTTRFSFFSFVESVAIKIGTDILEIDNKATYKVNGALDPEEAVTSFAGYPVAHSILENKSGKKTKALELTLSHSESLRLRIWDKFVGVFVDHGVGESSLFAGSLGMMGSFETGKMLGRDGETLIEDPGAFAAEWQVRNDGTDHILFQEARAPQHPQACFLPEHTERELLVSAATRAAAEKACEHWGKDKAECVYDVIATGNLDIANAEVY